MAPRPSLQVHKHAETTAFDGMHFRECKYNNPGVSLRGHDFAQFQNGFALQNFALALNDGQFTYVLDGYIQHALPPNAWFLSIVLYTWSTSSTILVICAR